MKHSVIDVIDLQKSFKKNEVLRGVSFTVDAGNVFCLLGSNGAGKTTTVRILSTLLAADGGEVTVCGFDIAKEPDKVRSCISLTGQYAAVDELLSGRENLTMMGRLLHVQNARQRIDDLLALFGLTDAADRRSVAYSGGMRRKLDIAMSLMASPQVLFLDEPTTGLDPQNRIAMWSVIEKLRDEGVTVFLTTQYLEEAERLADQVVILDKGVVVAHGTVDELKDLIHGGMVAFTFAEEDCDAARAVLVDWQVVEGDREANTVKVITDGRVGTLANMLIRMQNAHIEPLTFKQEQPTLEDVFFAQVGIGEGKDHVTRS